MMISDNNNIRNVITSFIVTRAVRVGIAQMFAELLGCFLAVFFFFQIEITTLYTADADTLFLYVVLLQSPRSIEDSKMSHCPRDARYSDNCDFIFYLIIIFYFIFHIVF